MKKYFELILAAAFILCANSCDRIEEIFSSPIVEREFTAVLGDNTRTSTDNEGNVSWEAGDIIRFYSAKNGPVGSATVPTSGNSATIRVQMEENAPFFIAEYGGTGITDNTSGNTFTITGAVEAVQSGAFKDAHVAVAKTYLDNGDEYKTLSFKNVTSIIKFTLVRDDVKKIVFTSANNETIHGNGTVRINFSGTEATPTFGTDGGSSITVNTNGAGTFYISTLPVNLTNGFRITCYNSEDEWVGKVTGLKSLNIKRNDIVNLGTLDSHITNESTNLSAAGTANCYIVSGAGSYRFKAVQGNTNTSVGPIEGVKVLWESYGTASPINTGDIIKPNVAFEDGYISFSTNDSFKKGNAVIAAYSDANCSDGNVLWSWHIWCTDYPSEQVYRNNAGTLMDRHLGACSTEEGNAQAYGLLYQWGRKDPFMGFSLGNQMISTINESVTASSATTGTIDYAISHPSTVIYNSDGNWLNENNPDLWSSNKTKYDPCPYGWRVPDADTWVNASFAQNCVSSATSGLLFTYNGNNSTWYPSTGNRDAHGALREPQKGFCWTNSEVSNHINSFFLYYDGLFFIKEKNNDCHKSSAFGVRCAKDEGSHLIYVTDITLDKASVELNVGEDTLLVATVIPNNAVNSGVTWSSSNTNVATVNGYGKVTAVFPGTATITASAGGKEAQCQITIIGSISLDKSEARLLPGERLHLIVTTTPENLGTITWSSSNNSIASVDENGNVIAHGLGETTISATIGDLISDCLITVYEGLLYLRINSNDALTEGHYLIVNEDSSYVLDGRLETFDIAGNYRSVKILTNSNNSIVLNDDINSSSFYYDSEKSSIKSYSGYYIGAKNNTHCLYSSENEKYSNTVSFVGNDADIVSITGPHLKFYDYTDQSRFRYYKESSLSGKKPIQLYKLITGSFDDVFLDTSSLELLIGEDSTLNAIVFPSDLAVSWSSSNTGVATVDNNGRVCARKEGTATITAQAGSHIASAIITVRKGNALLCDGMLFNSIIKEIALEDVGYSSVDNERVTRISFNTHSSDKTGIEISDGLSETPIYFVFDKASGTAHINTRASTINLPENASYMFSNFGALSEINNLRALKTDNVTDMTSMFSNVDCDTSYIQSLDLSSFNTAKVKSFKSMFNGQKSLESINLSGFDTSQAEDMSYMFQYCRHLKSLDLSNFVTTKVTDMQYMFAYCNDIESVNVSNFNTENCILMKYMFCHCETLSSIDLSSFNTENATDLSNIFWHCHSLQNISIPNFSFASATNVRSFLNRCDALQEIDLSHIDGTGITTSSACGFFFYGAKSLHIIRCGDTFRFGTAKPTSPFSEKSTAYELRCGSNYGSITIYCDQDICDYWASTGLRWLEHGYITGGSVTPIHTTFLHYQTGVELFPAEWPAD